jgi:hypothetical protein
MSLFQVIPSFLLAHFVAISSSFFALSSFLHGELVLRFDRKNAKL